MPADGYWTGDAILRESERWVWYPESAVRVEDERRFLVHMPEHWGFSVVQRSTAGNERAARSLIEHTIQETRDVGRGRLVWQTSGATTPAGMGDLLSERGFSVVEELEVLAFELGTGPELPQMRVPGDTIAELVRDVEGIREVHRLGSEIFDSHRPSEEEVEEYAGQLEKLERRERGELPGGPDDLLTLSFLAFTDRDGESDEPIASAGVTLAGEVARLWGGGTREEFRGRGAYGALVRERCRAAHAFGASLALVKARVGTSGPLLKRAGFWLAGTERRYGLALG